jgi:hypothetical protein
MFLIFYYKLRKNKISLIFALKMSKPKENEKINQPSKSDKKLKN